MNSAGSFMLISYRPQDLEEYFLELGTFSGDHLPPDHSTYEAIHAICDQVPLKTSSALPKPYGVQCAIDDENKDCSLTSSIQRPVRAISVTHHAMRAISARCVMPPTALAALPQAIHSLAIALLACPHEVRVRASTRGHHELEDARHGKGSCETHDPLVCDDRWPRVLCCRDRTRSCLLKTHGGRADGPLYALLCIVLGYMWPTLGETCCTHIKHWSFDSSLQQFLNAQQRLELVHPNLQYERLEAHTGCIWEIWVLDKGTTGPGSWLV